MTVLLGVATCYIPHLSRCPGTIMGHLSLCPKGQDNLDPLESLVMTTVRWVIKGWWHWFSYVVYGSLFRGLRRPHSWQKCKQVAKNDTFYGFLWQHPVITQLRLQYIQMTVLSGVAIWYRPCWSGSSSRIQESRFPSFSFWGRRASLLTDYKLRR